MIDKKDMLMMPRAPTKTMVAAAKKSIECCFKNGVSCFEIGYAAAVKAWEKENG